MSSESVVGDRRDLMRRVIARIEELEQRLKKAERQPKESIAVVGMACRFPGSVNNPEHYWQFLTEGRDGIRPFSPDRLGRETAATTLYGGFVDDVDKFDAAFF